MQDQTGAVESPLFDGRTLAVVEAFHDALARADGGRLLFDQVFRGIAVALRQSLGAEQVSIWVVDPRMHVGGAAEPGLIQAAYSTLPAEAAVRMPEAAPLFGTDIGQSFRDGRPRRCSPYDFDDARVRDLLPDGESAALWILPCRPLSLHFDEPEHNPHNIVAIATVSITDAARAAAVTPEIAAFFGRMCGKALERALWHEQELVIERVYEALDHVQNDRHGAMGAVAEAIRDSMRFEACTILQAEESRRVLHVLGTTGIDSNVPLRKMAYPYGFSCSGWIAENLRTLATEDFLACEQHQGPMYTDVVESADRRQYLGCPLRSAAGTLLGVIRLRNKRPPDGAAWPLGLNYLDRKRIERVARVIAPLISLVVKERERDAAMERIRHDIDMPATAIRDGAGMLLREPDSTFQNERERVRQRLEDMESFAEILLVNSELMGMTRAADVPFRPENVLPLAGFVAKLCKMLSPAARRRGLSGILYNQGSFFSIPALWMDTRLFQIAMYNLLQNAIKYSHPGTVVTVEGEAARIDGEPWYLIHVKNVGIGVSDDELPHIFERSYRSKRARKRSETGLGIGLSTARDLIQRHGGRLVLTRPTNPTTFTIQLPGHLATRKPE